MRKQLLFIIIPMALTAVFILAVPSLLRALPSRYVARLPEPVQTMGAPRTESAILPTVVGPAAATTLLNDAPAIATTATPVGEPPTPTPRLTGNQQNKEPTGRTTAVSPTTTPLPPTPASTPPPIPPAARLDGFRHKFQTWNNCGPATLAMTLSYFDLNLSQEQTAAFLKPNPEDRNVSPHEMAAYVEQETDLHALFRVNGDKDTLRRLLAHNIPVIVEIGIEPPGEYRWLGWYGHYLLLVAYDHTQEQFWAYDSWFGTSEEPLENAHPDGRILTYEELDANWPHFNRNYVAVYEPAQEKLVADVIGPAMEDDVMWATALDEVRAETAAQPDNAFFWFNLGTVYSTLERYEDAATAFDQARAIGLPWRMLWYQFGLYEAYYEVGRYEDVILLADTTLKDRPYFEESFYYKALALAAQGNANEARDNLQKAIDFNPNFAPAAEALQRLEIGA